MSVVEAYTYGNTLTQDDFNKASEELRVLSTGLCLCSNATVDEGIYGDPTEIALVILAKNLGLTKKELEHIYPRIEELPFDSVRKMMSTLHETEQGKIMYTKGALDSILNHTTKILDHGKERKITS